MTRARSIQPLSHRQLLLRSILGAVVIVLLLFVVATASALLIRSVVNPLITLQRVRAETNQWERKVAQKRRELASMEAKKQWWSSPNGKDELAHQMGLVKKDEQTVVVTPPASPAPKAPAPAARRAGALEGSPTLRLTMLTLVVCALVYGMLLFRRRRLLKTRQQETGFLTPRKELMRRRPVE
ncbi:MAG: hypothetical protein ACYDCO_22445 [Armatimonadota bacterium]